MSLYQCMQVEPQLVVARMSAPKNVQRENARTTHVRNTQTYVRLCDRERARGRRRGRSSHKRQKHTNKRQVL
jgi:hypothetical protein